MGKTRNSRLNRIDDNEEFHSWLKGEKSFKPNQESKAISIDLIDRVNIDNNNFSVTNQFVCAITKPEDAHKHIRPDVVLFVNGIPISVIECKFLGTEGSNYIEGVKQLDRYQRTTPKLFFPNVVSPSSSCFPRLLVQTVGSPCSPTVLPRFSYWVVGALSPDIPDNRISQITRYADNQTPGGPKMDDVQSQNSKN